MGNTVYAGPSASQSVTYEAVGVADDYSQIIINIEPEVNYFLANMREQENVNNITYGWFTEGLNPPKENAQLEDADFTTQRVGSVTSLNNHCQHFINTGRVSDAQIKVRKMYSEQNELNRQIKKAFIEQAQDMEYAIVNNSMSRLGTDLLGAKTGGIPYFMKEESVSITFGADNKITAVAAHELKTGDFIYLKGPSLPKELSKNLIYYIRKDGDSETVFTLHDTQKSAVEGGSAIAYTAGTHTGACLIKNNIVDLEDSAAFSVADINTCMEMAFRRGGKPTDIIMSTRNKRRFSEIAGTVSAPQRKQAEKKVIQVIDSIESDYGTLQAIPHRLYPDNRIDIFDNEYHGLAWFDRPHEVKGLAKQGSRQEFVLESWLGYKCLQPKASASIINSKRV